MPSETRRLVVAMLAAMAVFVGYQLIVAKFFPPPPPATQPAHATAPAAATGPAATPPAPPGAPALGTPPQPAPAAPSGPTQPTYIFAGGDTAGPVELGGRAGDALRAALSPRGAALVHLELTAQGKDGNYLYRSRPRVAEPYRILQPVEDTSGGVHLSFTTARLRVEEHDRSYPLDDLTWRILEQSPERVVFAAALRSAEGGAELLRLRKTYALHAQRPVLDIELTLENAGPAPLTVQIDQNGPLGIRQEGRQGDMRKVLAAQWYDGQVQLGPPRAWDDLKKAVTGSQPDGLPLLREGKGPLVWTALVNKFFGVYTRPRPLSGTLQDYVVAARALVVAPYAPDDPLDLADHGDLLARLTSRPTVVAAAGVLRYPFEIYAGPKDAEHIAAVDPDYTSAALNYQLVQSADQSCFCTVMWLQDLMVWLLHNIYLLVRNYGVAIMILVLLVRGLLHPLAVWQQKNMFRMQESMARIQPKMEALKERYANDKVKLQQETMKLWSDEGVNPMASVFSMLPMLIQMPILIALWSALNTDVSLRHEPFDGWWIRDLSAPDALVTFAQPLVIPFLEWHIYSLNLLPLLMGVSMLLQQKYMPKPRPAVSPTAHRPKRPGAMTPEQTMRQQQIMIGMMSVLFPIMLYNQPSGLNLYWMSSNIVGIFESLRIRKQIHEERERRAREGPPQPRLPGPVARFFRRLAAQAEELQKKADELAREEGRKGKKRS